MLKNNDNYDIYAAWRQKLLKVVSEDICSPCTDAQKKLHNIDYDNPLNCGCRCERVDNILASAGEIDREIKSFLEEEI